MPPSEQPSSPRPGSMVRGAAWMVAMRWCVRGIGLISTVILARLLTPEDFGIVAMGMLVVGLLDVIADAGVDLALIRNSRATRQHYDTAWTIQVLQRAILALLLVVIAPYAALYFDEPRVTPVMRVLALGVMFTGLQNIGVVAFRKDLDFAKEYRFGVYKKLLTFAVVVTLALLIRNYWALVIGIVVGSLAGILLSYGMHPYRPRPSLARAREIWSFSQWLLLSRVGTFLNRKTDQFVVGGVAGSAAMGSYHIAIEVSTAATNELIMPLRRALFPNYAKLLDDPPQFGAAVLRAVGILAMLCLSAGFGMAVVADDFIAVVFGDKWLSVVPLMQWLALFGAVSGLSLSFEIVLLVAGRSRLSALEAWLQLAVLVPLLAYVGYKWGIQEVAIARTCLAALFIPVMITLVTRACPITPLQIGLVLWRPLAAALLMAWVVTLLHGEMPEIPALRLLLDILVGGAVYSVTCLLLWRLAGRPEGAEQAILAFASGAYRSLLRRRDAAL